MKWFSTKGTMQQCVSGVCFRLATAITWSRAASWPRTRSCWTRGTPRWRWWISALETWGNDCTRREQRYRTYHELSIILISPDGFKLSGQLFYLSLLLQLSRMNGGGVSSPQTSSHPAGGVLGRVAAVCPYIQVPADGRQEAVYPLPADPPPKPTPLSHTRSLSGRSTPALHLFTFFLLIVLHLCPGSNLLSFYFLFLSVGSFFLFFSFPLSVVVVGVNVLTLLVHLWLSCCVTCWCRGGGCCCDRRCKCFCHVVMMSSRWCVCVCGVVHVVVVLLWWWVWPYDRGGQEWRQEPSQPMESVRFRHRPVRAHWDVGGASVPSGGQQYQWVPWRC